MNYISEIEWLDHSDTSRSRYNAVYDKVLLSNIPQIWDYGSVKNKTEGSDLIRGIIKDKDKTVGVVQILMKKKMGVPVGARVNRGPLFVAGYDSINNHMNVMNIVRQKIPHPIPVVYAPDIENTPENIAKLTKNKWSQWNPYGYETGVIDLSQSLEFIRKGFDSKWRNQLKASEKNELEIHCDFDRFDKIVSIYEASQKKKGYEGIPSDIIYELKSLEKTPLTVFYIINDTDEIIAFDIFYSTDNFGLYFVGWNDEEGRKMYANNLLLYHAVCKFKARGARWLDLGGIDYIDTEENARFKDGMRPRHIRLAGEFIRF